MNTYYLKDKIPVTNDFLEDLKNKSWQEIEYLQNQIVNLEIASENDPLSQLFKSLLTSYYVFIGGLENLSDIPQTIPKPSTKAKEEKSEVLSQDNCLPNDLVMQADKTNSSELKDLKGLNTKSANFEPFEYFVDFEEPTGMPITDADLYN